MKKFNKSENCIFIPKGSIAFKLGLLAVNAFDFVFSYRSKNIWDIAAGTLLCQRQGIRLYQKGHEIKNLCKPKYEGPLLWCRDKDYKFLAKKLEEYLS